MNMAIDEAVLRALIQSKSALTTLRFYTWSPPAISIGCLQRLGSADINLERAQKLGLDIVRRPTGGRIVLHKKDLTYSLAFTEGNPIIPRGILPSYQKISLAIRCGLESLGIPAQLCPERRINRTPFCFSLVAKYEILVHGKKIMGNAQKRERGSVLQQGSIMFENHRDIMYQLLSTALLPSSGGLPEAKPSAAKEEEFTCLEEVLVDRPSLEISEVKDALIKGFEEVFHISFISEPLTAWEMQEASRLCQEKYSQDTWNREGHL